LSKAGHPRPLFIKGILMRSMILSIFILGTIFSAALSSAEVISGIAAIVNDEIITIRELNREFDMASKDVEKKDGPLSVEAAKRLRSSILDSLVDRMLVKHKVKELNIVISEEEIRQSIEDVKRQNRLSQEAFVSALLSQGLTFDQYKAQLKDQLERLRLMSQEVKSKVQVSEKEVTDYYDANKASFSSEDSYRARAIFLRLDKDAGPEKIRSVILKLQTVMAAAKKGGDFAELAKKNSDDTNAQKDGGDLGFFKKGEMLADIEKIVFTLKTGEVEMICTPTGYYVIKLEEKSPGLAKPFEEVKGQINDTLYRKKSEERFTQWLQELRKGAAIEIKK
jgi:peptidyl-prolyl cis-trans isomerase SurA